MKTVKMTDFIEVMTIEKIKEEIKALNLSYNLTIEGKCEKYPLDIDIVMVHVFISMCEHYNRGHEHRIPFNWNSGGTMSINALIKLKEYFNVPDNVEILLDFWNGDDGVEGEAEFIWNTPYKDFIEFYIKEKNMFDNMLSTVSNQYKIYLKIKNKLNG